jgi:hypothetical protein
MEEKYLHCDVENDTICGLGLCFWHIVEYLYNFQEQEPSWHTAVWKQDSRWTDELPQPPFLHVWFHTLYYLLINL